MLRVCIFSVLAMIVIFTPCDSALPFSMHSYPKAYCDAILSGHNPNRVQWRINTSNQAKLDDFSRLFKKLDLQYGATSNNDLREIESTYIDVVAHKASQMDEGYLVEDSSLFVEGVDIGVNIKWMVRELDRYLDRAAVLVVAIAHRVGDIVFVYNAQVHGKLVQPRGRFQKGAMLDLFFQPHNSNLTLAELYGNPESDRFSPRFAALKMLKEKQYSACLPAIHNWYGPWQD